MTQVQIIRGDKSSPSFRNYNVGDILNVDDATAQHWKERELVKIIKPQPQLDTVKSNDLGKK